MKLVTVLFVGCAVSSVAQAEKIFKYDGTSVSETDLSPAERQRIYEAKLDAYLKIRAIAEDQAIQRYTKELSIKQRKSPEQVMEELLKNKDISDTEAKAWYDKNKERIPYPFDQVKAEVKRFMESERKDDARKELVARVQKEKNFEFRMDAPEAPRHKLSEEKLASLPVIGDRDAKVTVLEFADYHCPHCKEAAPILKKIVEAHGKKIRLLYADFPIRGEASKSLGRGGFCANKQKKFWDYNKLVFEKSPSLDNSTAEKVAEQLKLDMPAFKTCLTSTEASQHVDAWHNEGKELGVTGTPYILINGRRFIGATTFEELDRVVKINLKE